MADARLAAVTIEALGDGINPERRLIATTIEALTTGAGSSPSMLSAISIEVLTPAKTTLFIGWGVPIFNS